MEFHGCTVTDTSVCFAIFKLDGGGEEEMGYTHTAPITYIALQQKKSKEY